MSAQFSVKAIEGLTRVTLHRFEIPLSKAVPGGSAEASRTGFLLELSFVDGTHTVGEASPLEGYSVESLEEVEREMIGAAETLARGHMPEPIHPSSRFGIGSAIAMRSSASGLLPEPEQRENTVGISALVVASRAEVDTLAALVQTGYRSCKVKVALSNPTEEVDIVSEMADRFPECRLRIDANRRWSIDTAVDFGARLRKRLEQLGIVDNRIQYFEEPVSDASQLESFAVRTGFKVALDESIRDRRDWRTLVSAGRLGAVVIKPTLMGWEESIKAITAATDFGVPAVVSSSFESGVGLRALACMADRFGQAHADPDLCALGLGTYDWLVKDVVRPRLALSGPYVYPWRLANPAESLDNSTMKIVVDHEL